MCSKACPSPAVRLNSRTSYSRIGPVLFIGLMTGAPPPGQTADYAETDNSVYISLIIDDLGDRLRDGERALALPGQITYGILPFTPYAKKLASLAQQTQKEIILHLPMQSEHGNYLGKGGLHEGMSQSEFTTSVQASLAAVPHVRGINNHMGSLLTQKSVMMDWLMKDLANRRDLYFVDSVTTSNSQAHSAAEKFGVATTVRDIFLDNQRDPAALQQQWQEILQRAKRKPGVLAIAHPYPETLRFLQQALPQLSAEGVQLISVSTFIQRQQQRRLAWQTSSFPLPRAAKNSKP